VDDIRFHAKYQDHKTANWLAVSTWQNQNNEVWCDAVRDITKMDSKLLYMRHSDTHMYTDSQQWYINSIHRPGDAKFLFSGQKKLEISGHFSGHQSHKNACFAISGAYNFGTFRAEAKLTIWRHEVVYRLSSQHKMIDLEWHLHAILMLKSGTTLLSLCPVLFTHK